MLVDRVVSLRYSIYVWQMCIQALEELGGHARYIPLIDIVQKVHELWPDENVNKGTIRDQTFRHCINCHPTHDEFPDKGKMWKRRKLFVTDGEGNYRFYDENKDKEMYHLAVMEDEQ